MPPRSRRFPRALATSAKARALVHNQTPLRAEQRVKAVDGQQSGTFSGHAKRLA